jgi:hypothetical protein
MQYVRLDKDWVDDNGVAHTAGEMLLIDAPTLARLSDEGIVGDSSTEDQEDWQADWQEEQWSGPTEESESWAGPVEAESEEW